MAFRHHSFKPLRFSPSPVDVDKQISQFDENGVERVTSVSVPSSPLSIPSPSEYTINFAMTAGDLSPVNLDDFTLDASASDTVSTDFSVPNND